MIDYEHCQSNSDKLGETNDCAVNTCAIAAQIDYPTMREYLKSCGRIDRRGMTPNQYLSALRGLGLVLHRLRGPRYVQVTRRVRSRTYACSYERRTTTRVVPGSGRDYQSATFASLVKELTTGTYIVASASHVVCIRDGVMHDWAAGRRYRIESVYRVTEV